ncbi:hypothetical protein HK100_010174, partial [Physocladia obscura]
MMTLEIPMSKEACLIVNNVQLFEWHFAFITFDFFILYKSYITTESSFVFLTCAATVLAYRCVWAVVDLIFTKAAWTRDDQFCGFYADIFSSVNYDVADLACDFVATAGAVAMFLKEEPGILRHRD